MTFENRMRFLLKDIQTILLQCGKCGAKVSHDLSTPIVRYKCPDESCHQNWGLDIHHHLNKIIVGLNTYLHEQDSSARPFDIAFELKDPPDARPGASE